MRKLTLMLAAASIALGASAQLKVVESGQVQVGQYNSLETSLPTITPQSNVMPTLDVVKPGFSYGELTPDSLATFRVIGPRINQSGGKIAFGGMGYTYIAEDLNNSSFVQKNNRNNLINESKL